MALRRYWMPPHRSQISSNWRARISAPRFRVRPVSSRLNSHISISSLPARGEEKRERGRERERESERKRERERDRERERERKKKKRGEKQRQRMRIKVGM